MLATMMPLFDGNIAVKAYSLFAQKENFLLNPSLLGTGSLDGAGNIIGLDAIESLGTSTLEADQVFFVEISKVSVFSAIDELCSVPAVRIVLLADQTMPCEPMYLQRLEQLKAMGYKIAMKGLKIEQFEEYAPMLRLLDYMMLDYKKLNIAGAKAFFSRVYPNVSLIAVNVDSQDDFDMLASSEAYRLFEGDFYRIPVTQGSKEVSPLKVNYIELLNMANDLDFELTKAADVIGRDTALVIELLKVVNRMSVNSEITSIRHAAAMLGQKELRKWISAVVTHQLCADKPSEITRLSLLRAKFAENLAPIFGIAGLSSEMFLMGLFSVLDIILDKPMDEALKMVSVSKQITDALCKGKGDMADVFEFIKNYELASWSEVSRIMVLKKIDENAVYTAYTDSLKWYRDLFSAD